MYIHVIGVTLFLACAALLSHLSIAELRYTELVADGTTAYFADYPLTAMFSLLVYLGYITISAELLGAYQFPHKAASTVSGPAMWLAHRLRWLPAPQAAHPQTPVWYDIFHQETNGFANNRPRLLVRLKGGDTYIGELGTYPLLSDDQPDKDFSITKAVWLSSISPDDPLTLTDQPGGGTVLLNTTNVESIQVYYQPTADPAVEPSG